ncbi:MAG: protein-glutamate O-methyltransferase CheR [Ktedonobacterales bacterium]|nr:protein-glutamate O-methyltransferase CheR [Ktedonobacterales bacterium]
MPLDAHRSTPLPVASALSHTSPTDPGFPLVQRRLLDLTGIDLDAYKRPQMMRRLDAILARCHLASLTALANELKPNSEVLKEFMERFTINVSECFRDKPRFEQLQRQIIPEMAKRNAALRLWSAGCSYGAEPYSLAIILREANLTRAAITATDIDPKILAAAKAGESFTSNDFRNLTPEIAKRYFTVTPTGTFRATEALRPFITFRQQNLLQPPPGKDFDIVLCRNVTIYFTEESKDQVTQHLVDALRPGGILFIGETETIHRPQRFGLTLRSTSFYEKAG